MRRPDHAQLFALHDHAIVELKGKDRQAFFHNFCTNDIKRLQPGTGCEAFITSIKGRVLSFVRVFVGADALWIDCDSGTADDLVAHLDKYLISEDVQIRSLADEVCVLYLCGPDAVTRLHDHAASAPLERSDWPLFTLFDTTIGGAPVMLVRCDLTQPTGCLLLVKREHKGQVWEAIVQIGVQAASADVFEALRIEAGTPRSVVDIGEPNIAQEAGRTSQAISFTKGCYLGQEPIARLDALGHVNQELRSIRFRAGPTPAAGTRVHKSDGAEVGTITSSAVSYEGEPHPVALALLRTSVTAPGSMVSVDAGAGAMLQGTVFWHLLDGTSP